MALLSKASVYSVHPVCRLDSAARMEERPSTGDREKTKTRTRVHDEGGGISHEEAEGQRARNKDERIRGTMDAGEDGR